MRWKGRERSQNVRDQRGMAPGKMAAGGGIGVLLLAVVAFLFGGDPQKILQAQKAAQQQQGQQPNAEVGKDDEAREFVEVVVKTTEDVWQKLFADNGVQYAKPVVNLFSGQVVSKCGAASSAMGPFYCPADRQVYIDPTFFHELATRHQAPGDFAQAFVIAHEVGHHIQNELGWNKRANAARRSGNKIQANQESVRLELQADYLAGVWAHHAHKRFGVLEQGDLAEAMKAAIQIGDDTLQKQARGRVIPENFTHGSAKQRQYWFMKGVEAGNFPKAVVLFEIPYDEL